MTSNNTNPSPNVLLNGNTPPYILPSGGTMTVSLASSAGVSLWSITCVGVDDVTGVAGQASINAQLQASINRSTNTATFTVPSNSTNGSAVILQSTVNNGIDSQSIQQPSYTTTCKTGCLSAEGGPIYAMGETTQGGPFGWLPGVNNAARSSTSVGNFPVGVAAGGDLHGTYPNPSVGTNSGTVGQVLGFDGSHAVWVDQTGGGGSSGSAATYQVLQLLNVSPSSSNELVFVDGYSAANDGGPTASAGAFYWNSAYSGPSNPLNVVPDGYATGAWTRVIGTDNTILATWFGAKGDMNLQGVLETDDTAAIQAMLDINNGNFGGLLSGQSDANNRKFVCKLPATAYQYHSNLTASRTCYRITQPLQMSDTFINYFGNTTNQFIGEPGANSGLYYWEFLGPAVVCGNYGFNQPAYVLDPNGSGETLVLFTPISGGPATTIAAGSDGQTLPQSTIHVVDTTGYTTAGQFSVGGVMVAYTGLTSNTFTGCSVFNTFGAALPTLHTGDALILPSSPQWNFSEYDTGDLSGFTNFCFEFFINPCNSTAWLNLPQNANYIASMFGCAGNIGSLVNHTTFSLIQTNENTNNELIFGLTTVNGTYQVNTSTSVDHTWTANTLNHIAITYDGAHLRMFVNGAQPDSSMTIAATGALDQRWYESLTLCSGGNVAWPVFGGSGSFQPGPCMLLGKSRLSNIARYTAPFTAPLPSAVTCDTNTRLYLDFAAASIPTRGGLKGFNIAQCGQGLHGSVVGGKGFPVWLKNFANGVTYTGFNQIKSLFIHGAGTGIYTSASTNSEFGEDCFFLQGENGIILDNFSYNSGIGKGVTFWQMGASTNAHCLSSEVVFGHGVQFAYMLDGAQSEGQSNWFVVCVNADARIGTCFPNGFKQGTFAVVQNGSSIFMSGTTILDDQTSGFGLCGLLMAPSGGPQQASLMWNGGYIGMEQTHSAPVFLIAEAGVPVNINTVIYASGIPIFSFQGGGASTTTPAVFSGGNAFAMPYVDVANPGPVIVNQQEAYGINTIDGYLGTTYVTSPSDGYEISWTQFLYGTLIFTDTGNHFHTSQTIFLPTVINYQRTVLNQTGQNLTFQGLTGSGITVASNKSARLLGNGTNWVRLSPDT